MKYFPLLFLAITFFAACKDDEASSSIIGEWILNDYEYLRITESTNGLPASFESKYFSGDFILTIEENGTFSRSESATTRAIEISEGDTVAVNFEHNFGESQGTYSFDDGKLQFIYIDPNGSAPPIYSELYDYSISESELSFHSKIDTFLSQGNRPLTISESSIYRRN